MIIVLAAPCGALGQSVAIDAGFARTLANDIRDDFRHHYSLHGLGNTAAGFGISGLLANSNADQYMQNFVRDELQGRAGDNLAGLFTGMGDAAQPLNAMPVYLGAMWLGGYSTDAEAPLARWGAHSLRTILVGTPELVALSRLSGGQRPEEGAPGWNRFADDNGVSGHAFYGAAPIISAARMTDARWLRYSLLAASTLPGLARVYDDKHYLSQSFMGWWLAYQASGSVEQTNRDRQHNFRIMPMPYPDGAGLQVSITF